jgi:hypothetical protein
MGKPFKAASGPPAATLPATNHVANAKTGKQTNHKANGKFGHFFPNLVIAMARTASPLFLLPLDEPSQ